MIPYGKQWISEDDIEAVVACLRSDFLTTGPQIEIFENALCSYLGVKHAIAVSNGTAALHAACYAAGIGQGDEVVTTAMTFAATANAVLYCGGTPVFADIDSFTGNIDPESVRKKITSRTKAIIAVHYAGLPCDMEAISAIAGEHGLKVIEDGAHVLGAEKNGQILGVTGDMMTLSFHPVKHITTGEGGAIITDDDVLARELRRFRTHGIVRGESMEKRHDEPWFYEQQALGFNYRITDFQCALGASQLKALPEFLARRRAIASRYDAAFSNVEGLGLPGRVAGLDSSWHIYVIRLELEKLKVTRKEIFLKLKDQGLGVNVHYVPVYYHPYYRDLGYEKGLCPATERFYEQIITIPLYPAMTDMDVEAVIQILKETITSYVK